jgi:hypothetical protein
MEVANEKFCVCWTHTNGLRPLGRHICGHENNVRMDIKEGLREAGMDSSG